MLRAFCQAAEDHHMSCLLWHANVQWLDFIASSCNCAHLEQRHSVYMNMCAARSGTGSRQGDRSRSRAAGRECVPTWHVSGAAGGGLQERRPGRHGQVWEEAQALMRLRRGILCTVAVGDSHHGSCAALVILECGHCAQRRLTVAIVTAGSVDIRVFVRGNHPIY